MSQKQPFEAIQTILDKLPQSSWAKLLLAFLCLNLFLQFITGSTSTFIALLITCAFWLLVNIYEQQQQQIQLLEQRLEQLEQYRITTEQVETLTEQIQPLNNQQDEYLDRTILEQHTAIPEQQVEPASEMATALRQKLIAEIKDDADTLKELKVMTSLWSAALDWFKGGNSIVRIAIIVLLVGVVLLLRFASEHWQLTLSVRMAGIATGGLALVALGYGLRKKRFEYAISLQGAGLGIVFLVLFSAYHLGVIQSISLAYGLLLALLAGTLLLALQQNALILAFIALGNGFIAPFILNTGNNNVSALMAYYFLLNLAIAVIAWFKPWRILNTVALVMTFGIGAASIWLHAEPEQYQQIAIWVWAIFALYLFISIRYSLLITPLKQKFRDIPLVDSTLIFVTPFMAFSLYAGLVDSDGYTLSFASALLAVVYLIVGWLLHRKVKNLSILPQCFYGLGLVFTALILPFAFDAYWTSVGWAIHGVVMLYLGWQYAMRNARYFGAVLVFASGVATILAKILDKQEVLFASSVLMLCYAFAAYSFAYTPLFKPQQDRSFDKFLSIIFIVLSFLLAPYIYSHFIDTKIWQMYLGSVSILLWFVILSAIYWLKHKTMYRDWTILGLVVLVVSAVITASCVIDHWYFFQHYQLDGVTQLELLINALLWLMAWGIVQYASKMSNILYDLKSSLSVMAVLFLALMGGIWATSYTQMYLWAILPIVILIASIFIVRLKSYQSYWVGNLGIIFLAVFAVCFFSVVHTGQWSLPYIPVLNPIDLTSIALFVLLVFAMQPYLKQNNRLIQIFSAATILFTGLFLVSSIMLRVLHHYIELPYWSLQAWQDSTVQACLTILWASIALLLTTLASRKAWRYIWMLGIAVLAVVIFKLIFLDLSHSHTLTRIVSFIGSGLIMLVIGYLAPLPPSIAVQQPKGE